MSRRERKNKNVLLVRSLFAECLKKISCLFAFLIKDKNTLGDFIEVIY